MGAVGILSDQSFPSLNEAVCEPTLKAIADMGFTHMTEIQVCFIFYFIYFLSRNKHRYRDQNIIK